MGMFVMVFATTAFASIDSSQKNWKEIRTENITIDQIHLTKHGMFVYTGRHFYPVLSLHSNSEGGYSCEYLWEPHF
jgi:hypothetical protein